MSLHREAEGRHIMETDTRESVVSRTTETPVRRPAESSVNRAAKVLGVAAVSGGAVSGLASMLARRRREPGVQVHLRLTAEDLKGLDTGSEILLVGQSPAVTKAPVQAELEAALLESKMQKQGKTERKPSTSPAFSEHMRKALLEGAERFGENLPIAVEKGAASLNQYAELFSEVNSKKNRKKLNKNRKKLQKKMEKGQKQLSARANEGRSDLLKFRKEARNTSQDRLHELESRARELEGKARKTLDKQLKPSLEKAAEAAKIGAIEARKRIEQEAEELEKRYAKAVPKLDKSADQYASKAAKLRQELLHAAEKRAHEAEQALQQSTLQARQAALGAGESAKEGGKNFGSLILWLTIAGAVVYAFLLDEEKKRKARELAGSAYHEGKAIYQDVRGENADFSMTDTPTNTTDTSINTNV